MHLKLPDFSSSAVLVAGDLMLDRYWQGPTSRISPEAPVPVVKVEDDEFRPGGAANVALNAAALGSRVSLLGLVGNDAAASELERYLTQVGVTCRFTVANGRHTITKLRVLSKNQQLLRLDFEDAFPADVDDDLVSRYRDSLSRAQAVVLSDYAKGALRRVRELINLARELKLPVVVDPKGQDFERYRGATVLTPNQAEFEAVVGRPVDEPDLLARGEVLRRKLDLHALLITRSEKGMTLLMEGRSPVHLPTHAREVYDVTGAGDTVVGVLAAALGAGVDLHEAVMLSNLAAGVVVGKVGTATVSPAELAEAMEMHLPMRRGVVSADELSALVERAKSAGERIVMTNGCFDILHAGHVSYLQQARALGDRLIVAVNDDASVRLLKGVGRPVNPLLARQSVLAALAAVDWVVSFSEETPERLICQICPDVLVKGGDYQPEGIAGAKCVLEKGGDVTVMPFIEGHSTTKIIQSLKKV